MASEPQSLSKRIRDAERCLVAAERRHAKELYRMRMLVNGLRGQCKHDGRKRRHESHEAGSWTECLICGKEV